MSKVLSGYCRSMVNKYGMYGAWIPCCSRTHSIRIDKLFNHEHATVGFHITLLDTAQKSQRLINLDIKKCDYPYL